MENVGIFYDHFEYFTAIGHNFWPFGMYMAKSGNPAATSLAYKEMDQFF
jgi:hypothetical protein